MTRSFFTTRTGSPCVCCRVTSLPESRLSRIRWHGSKSSLRNGSPSPRAQWPRLSLERSHAPGFQCPWPDELSDARIDAEVQARGLSSRDAHHLWEILAVVNASPLQFNAVCAW